MDLIKESCGSELRESFVEALATLSTKQRNLLRYHFVDGLSAGEIARIYRAHRSSVTRWLSETKAALELEMRAGLSRRLKLSGSELDSLVRAAWSGFDVTMTRYLAKNG
jgi:RNA polymerase sigma-70 factor (ECF subfamily)